MTNYTNMQHFEPWELNEMDKEPDELPPFILTADKLAYIDATDPLQGWFADYKGDPELSAVCKALIDDHKNAAVWWLLESLMTKKNRHLLDAADPFCRDAYDLVTYGVQLIQEQEL